jgi:hypothetical protein
LDFEMQDWSDLNFFDALYGKGRSMLRILAIVLLMLLPQVAHAERYALLIGAAHFPNAPKIPPLDGPVNDVEALRAELLRSWKVSPDKITVLVEQAASRNAILAALDAMIAKAVAGDEVLLYYSGHGTSAHDPNSPRLGLDLSTGAIVPTDIRESSNAQETVAQLIVGSRDLRPRLEKLDQKNARALVVFDACYSGETAKDIPVLRPRNANLLADAVVAPETLSAFGAALKEADQAEEWPYRNIVYISAAARHELAWDIPAAEARTTRPTVDGKAHGAFTNALLIGLKGAADTDHDRKISYEELHGFLVNQLQREGQTPQLHPKGGDVARQTVLTASGQAAPASRVSRRLRVWLSTPDAVMRERIQLVRRADLVTDAYDIEIRAEGTGYRAFHPSGAAITSKTLSAAETLLLLEKRSQSNLLTTLAFPMQDFNVSLTMDPDQGAYYEGERVKVQLQPSRDSWLLVFDIDVEGNVYLVYPHERSDFRKVGAGETVTGTELVSAVPFGVEILQVFAFTQKPAFYDVLQGTLRLTESQAIGLLEQLEKDASSPGRSQTQRVTYTLQR